MSSSTDPPRVLIMIPAYNEEDAIGRTIDAVLQHCPGADILVLNDGSRDGTAQVVDDLVARLKTRRVRLANIPLNTGIGGAIQTGFIHAARGRYEYAVQHDGDGQHDPAAIPLLLAETRAKDLDLCVGSRFLAPTAAGYRGTVLRRLGITFFARLISCIAGVRVTDPTSGFRVYSRRAIAVFSRYYPTDYPEPEALSYCVRNHLRVAEFPVVMRHREGGQSSIRHFHTAYYMVKVTLAILVDWIRKTEGAET